MSENVFKPRRGSAARIRELNPILQDGELCFAYPDDGSTRGPKGDIKIGDGVTPYKSLPSFLTQGNFVDKDKDVGKAYGVVPLDGLKLIDRQYIPDSVDNIEFHNNKGDFPNRGLPHKIYINLSEEYNNSYRWNDATDEYEKYSTPLTYRLEKEGSSVKLKCSDGSSSSIDNVGGVEIRDTNPSPSELYPGKMWILRN